MKKKMLIVSVELSLNLLIFKEHNKWSIILHILLINPLNLSSNLFTFCLELFLLIIWRLYTQTTFWKNILSLYNKKSTTLLLFQVDTLLSMLSWKLSYQMLFTICFGQSMLSLKSNSFIMKTFIWRKIVFYVWEFIKMEKIWHFYQMPMLGSIQLKMFIPF